MGPQPTSSPKLVFGPFEYDTVSGDLYKSGTRIRLQGKPLQILSLLVDRHGEVVSREELRQHLWQDTTFVDFEQGLNAAVNKLRQALGDAAVQPRYVETLPGRGYRFVAPVHEVTARTVLEIAAPAAPRSDRSRASRLKRWMPWAATAAAVLLLAGSYWLGTRSERQSGTSQLTRFAVSPPAGFALEGAASRQAFALSPDGSRIAFTAMDASSALSVFVRELSALEPKLIPDTTGAHTLFWGPDSHSLYLTALGKLRRTTVDGGGMDVLGDTPAFLFSGVWLSPDRLMLSTNWGSFLVSPSKGGLEPTKTIHRWPQLLPDGETFLHMEWDAQALRHRARAGRMDEPGKELVLADSRVLYTASVLTPGQGYLLYLRSGNLLAHPFDPKLLQVTGEPMPVASKVNSFFPTGAADFSVSARGAIAYQGFVARSQLVWVDRQGRQTGTIGPDKLAVKSGRLSPDGRRLAAAVYDVERGGQDIWTFDLQSGAGRRLSLGPGVSDAPVWSPDSKQLAMLSASGGKWPEVHVRGLGANDTEQALMPGEFQMPTDWSSDGRFVVFSTTGVSRFPNEANGDVWVTDFANKRKTTPLLNSPFHEANATFSPDGKWLAFTSNESGRTELYLQAFEAASSPRVVGERLLVSRSGVLALRWRRDGKELFYLGFDGRVNAVPVKLSATPEFRSPVPLFSISTDARAAIHTLVGFDVSPDGQRFVIPVVTSPDAPKLVVVQDWEAMLPRRR